MLRHSTTHTPLASSEEALMPSSEWPTPEAIEAHLAALSKSCGWGPETADGYREDAADALTAAAKASPVIPAPPTDHIEWWDEPDTNSRWYRHVGCDTSGRWVVPLDDCPPPSSDTAECGHCCYVRPLQARGAEVKDLRGVEHRSVHRDDVVVITGAEYLRKSRLAGEAEAARQLGEALGEGEPDR